MLGPELVEEASQRISVIRDRLLTAQSRQRSYADRRRRDLEFDVGDSLFAGFSLERSDPVREEGEVEPLIHRIF
ncbi:hypothetical protein Dimus_039320 [Dionaea muscipula]